MNLFTGVVGGWIGRRALELGGLLGALIGGGLAIYNGMGTAQQESVVALLTGNWQDATLGAVIPLAIYLFSQVLSFRATVKPQIVTEDGNKVSTRDLPTSTKTLVEAQAETVVERKKRRPSIFQRMFGKRV